MYRVKNFGAFSWRRGRDYLKKGETPQEGDTLCLDFYLEGKRKRIVFVKLLSNSDGEIARLEKSARLKLDEIGRSVESGAIFDSKENFPKYEQMALFWWEQFYTKKDYMLDHGRQSSDFGKLLYAIDYFKNKTGDEISRGDVKSFRMHLRDIGNKHKKKWKNAYINRIVAMVGQVYHHCIEQEHWSYKTASGNEAVRYGNIDLCVKLENPVHGLPKLYEDPITHVIPSPEQFKTFLTLLNPVQRYWAIIGICTGLRPKNIRLLRTSEVDLFKKEIVIKDSNVKNGMPLIFSMGNILQWLFTHLKKEWRPDQEFVFESHPGKPYTDMHESWGVAASNAGISGFKFRELRTACCSWLSGNGMTGMQLQSLLGHTTTRTTERYYNRAQGASEIANPIIEQLLDGLVPQCDQRGDQSVTKTM